MDKFFVGFGLPEREYVINGVRYFVENRYEPVNFKDMSQDTKMGSRLEKYLVSDFADLPPVQTDDKIDAGYVCTAAGKEDNYAAEN